MVAQTACPVNRFIAANKTHKYFNYSIFFTHWFTEPHAYSNFKFHFLDYGFFFYFVLSIESSAIFLYANQLTKFSSLIPFFLGEEPPIVVKVAQIFFYSIVRYFGITTYVIHCHETIFTTDFYLSLLKLFGLNFFATSAYYTDWAHKLYYWSSLLCSVTLLKPNKICLTMVL